MSSPTVHQLLTFDDEENNFGKEWDYSDESSEELVDHDAPLHYDPETVYIEPVTPKTTPSVVKMGPPTGSISTSGAKKYALEHGVDINQVNPAKHSTVTTIQDVANHIILASENLDADTKYNDFEEEIEAIQSKLIDEELAFKLSKLDSIFGE